MMPRQANCRSCCARIAWLVTKLGKKMPVNYDSIAATDNAGTIYDASRHKSHYGTCPQAKTWKKTP